MNRVTNCSTCKKPAPINELIIYRGRCENCYIKIFQITGAVFNERQVTNVIGSGKFRKGKEHVSY